MTARNQLPWLFECMFYQKHAWKQYYIIKKKKKKRFVSNSSHPYDCVATVFTAPLINWKNRLQFYCCLIRKLVYDADFSVGTFVTQDFFLFLYRL